jgi:hypothetical protein
VAEGSDLKVPQGTNKGLSRKAKTVRFGKSDVERAKAHRCQAVHKGLCRPNESSGVKPVASSRLYGTMDHIVVGREKRERS